MQGIGAADGHSDLQGSDNAADGPFPGLKQWRRRELNPRPKTIRRSVYMLVPLI